VKRYAKADDAAPKHGGSDAGSGSDEEGGGAYLSSSEEEDDTPGALPETPYAILCRSSEFAQCTTLAEKRLVGASSQR